MIYFLREATTKKGLPPITAESLRTALVRGSRSSVFPKESERSKTYKIMLPHSILAISLYKEVELDLSIRLGSLKEM